MDVSHHSVLKSAGSSWWYQGRAFVVDKLLKGIRPQVGLVLDYGAGYGQMLPLLSKYGSVHAYEVYEPCIVACRARDYAEVIAVDKVLDARKGHYTLIGAFDVIEHIEDDAGYISRMKSLLAPGGLFVATVPAHQFLWSTYDEVNHHYRRYSWHSFRNLFESAGYEVVEQSYWNIALFPLAAIMRLSGKGGGAWFFPPIFINRALTFLLRIEAVLAPWPRWIPGLSLVIVARRLGAVDSRDI